MILCQDPTPVVLRKEDLARTKGTGASLTPEMLGSNNTDAMDHALLEMHFSICALTGPRPQVELSLAVKSTDPVPGPIFLPAVFKHCFQTVHQSHKGGTSDASLLKETSTAHGAKQGGNSTMPSPLEPYRH